METILLPPISNYLGSRFDLNVAGRIHSSNRTDYWNNQIKVEVYYPSLKRDARGVLRIKEVRVVVSSIDSKIFSDMVRNLEQITKPEATLTN